MVCLVVVLEFDHPDPGDRFGHFRMGVLILAYGCNKGTSGLSPSRPRMHCSAQWKAVTLFPDGGRHLRGSVSPLGALSPHGFHVWFLWLWRASGEDAMNPPC